MLRGGEEERQKRFVFFELRLFLEEMMIFVNVVSTILKMLAALASPGESNQATSYKSIKC